MENQNFKLGTCYYPEHWSADLWEDDTQKMVEAGISYVRIGEFCWSKIEPKPNHFSWDWLDQAIETLGKADLKIILCTPTATPPIWMLEKIPTMLAVDKNGQPRKYGSRRHYCFSNEDYKKECQRICEILSKRYGKNPHIIAWQIDNEYGCHDTTISYSHAALVGFQKWLAEKYKNIEALNTAWGNIFWSMEYSRFEQIDLPNMTVTTPNPSHLLDFHRYSSDQVVHFNRMQVDVLRRHTHVPLLHNYMGRITDFDHYKVGDDLDIATWDSYPLGFLEDRLQLGENEKKEFSRQGHPDFQAFHHDLYRTVGKGRFWIMEQQPGPVNWAPYNPCPLPGMIRLWTWEAFAHSAEAVCYFRWRQLPFAQEQMHTGMLYHDGKPTSTFSQAQQVAKEIKSLGKMEAATSKVAIVFDYQSHWAWEIQPHGRDFNYFELVFDFYKALRKLGLSIDIIPPNGEKIHQYRMVLMPGLMAISSNLKKAIDSFKGTLLMGPRSLTKTQDFHLPQKLPDLAKLNFRIRHVESLRPNVSVELSQGGSFFHWFEHVEGNATVLETTKQKNEPAILSDDNLLYIVGWPDEIALNRLLKRACQKENIETVDLPEGVRIRNTKSHRFFFNYGSTAATVHGKKLPPASVDWKKI